MRTIKFRGKEITSGEWICGYYTQGAFIDPTTGEKTVRHLIHADHLFDVRENTVGQFTGLTDKNGNEIYEGDILKVYYYGKSKIFGFVKFGESRFYIDDDFMRDSLKSKAPMAEMFSRYDFEVIGNVVDNPDLLKGGER